MKLKYKISTILVVVLLIGVISFSVLDFTPHLVKVFSLKQKLNERQSNFENLQQELNNKKSMLKTKLEGEMGEKKLLKAIPYQMKTNQFLNQLKKLIAKTKLKLNKYSPEETIEKEGYFKLPILLEVTGDYDSLNSFFKELENSTRLVTIEQVKIFNNDSGQLKSELLIAIYSLVQEQDKT